MKFLDRQLVRGGIVLKALSFIGGLGFVIWAVWSLLT